MDRAVFEGQLPLYRIGLIVVDVAGVEGHGASRDKYTTSLRATHKRGGTLAVSKSEHPNWGVEVGCKGVEAP